LSSSGLDDAHYSGNVSMSSTSISSTEELIKSIKAINAGETLVSGEELELNRNILRLWEYDLEKKRTKQKKLDEEREAREAAEAQLLAIEREAAIEREKKRKDEEEAAAAEAAAAAAAAAGENQVTAKVEAEEPQIDAKNMAHILENKSPRITQIQTDIGTKKSYEKVGVIVLFFLIIFIDY
jgi:uncharacterized membrane protein